MEKEERSPGPLVGAQGISFIFYHMDAKEDDGDGDDGFRKAGRHVVEKIENRLRQVKNAVGHKMDQVAEAVPEHRAAEADEQDGDEPGVAL